MTLYLEQALALAQEYRGFCAPNPAVGALVVKNGLVVGHGAHKAFGDDHAEVVALQQAGHAAKGADLYVTLVPCHHVGKTPPCTKAIIAAGIARVFFAYRDPGEMVCSDESIKQLSTAGIVCQQQPHARISAFYESYTFWVKHKRPYVTAKLALSLDGMSGIKGDRAIITGAGLQRHCHHKRYHSDAILTTVNTVLADDPQLNCRLDGRLVAKPVFVLDRELKLPMQAQLWDTAKDLVLFYDETYADRVAVYQEKGATCIPIKVEALSTGQTGLAWSEVLALIGDYGVHDLWVEAGANCFSSLLAGGWLQRAWLYYGTKVLGGGALPGLRGAQLSAWEKARCRWVDIEGEGACEMTWGQEVCLQD